MLVAANVDETFSPVDVSLLGAQDVTPNTQRYTRLIEQPRRLATEVFVAKGEVMLHGKTARYAAPMVQLNLRWASESA